jgi:hypothetical protein
MRKKGSIFILEKERNEDLMRIYREITKKQLNLYGRVCHAKILEKVVNSQASRYWVSPERASSIIYKMEKGMSFKGMKKNTVLFYKSLYYDYRLYKDFHPKMSTRAIVEEVLMQPAPCFLITPRVAGDVIYKMKKKCQQQTIRNLRCSY